MYFDYEWVKQYLAGAPSLEEAARLLNSTGLETEIVEGGLEVEHTVNRSDAMCHYGIARELAVKQGLGMVEPAIYEGELPPLEDFEITSEDSSECHRYIGVMVEGVTASDSPEWLQQRLAAIGQTCHNLLVDLTNFLLWEFSHPSHAFDADKLSGNRIHVRRGTSGERLTTLDGRDHDVADMVCITDASGPIALAGVMGGENTEVDRNTTRLLLELGVFRGVTCRRTGNATNIHSDARHRFERGVDEENMNRVIRRFLFLLRMEQPKMRVIGVRDMELKPYVRKEVRLHRRQLDRLLGIALGDEEVDALLTRMDFRPERIEGGWDLAVPGYKVDVARECDVIEELIRFAGLDRLSSDLPAFSGSNYNPDKLLLRGDEVREALRGMGLQEAITFSFGPEAQDATMPGAEPVTLRNPMTRNQAVLRRNILPGLLGSVRHNASRGMSNLALFELGHTFGPKHEPHHLAVVLSFGKDQVHWWGDVGGHPFYRIKGVYETLAVRLGFEDLILKEDAPVWLKPGEALGIWRGDTCLGGLGTLSADMAGRFDLDNPPMVLELNIDFLHEAGHDPIANAELSNFPSMKIDLAFVLDKHHAFGTISQHIQSLQLDNLETLKLFDVYEGKALDKGKKSLGFRFRFRAPDRTLTSEEVAATMERVKASVCEHYGATIRI